MRWRLGGASRPNPAVPPRTTVSTTPCAEGGRWRGQEKDLGTQQSAWAAGTTPPRGRGPRGNVDGGGGGMEGREARSDQVAVEGLGGCPTVGGQRRNQRRRSPYHRRRQ